MGKPGPTPKGGPGTTIGVRCQKPFLDAVDEWRLKQRGQVVTPSRAAALRFLAERGLEAEKRGAKR
jgi:hypothetical protein